MNRIIWTIISTSPFYKSSDFTLPDSLRRRRGIFLLSNGVSFFSVSGCCLSDSLDERKNSKFQKFRFHLKLDTTSSIVWIIRLLNWLIAQNTWAKISMIRPWPWVIPFQYTAFFLRFFFIFLNLIFGTCCHILVPTNI